ncbi:MAG: DUF3088 family protein [Chloroflexi bacterium]|jgi:hypothetical protein|nr:DUF3088 family protein [Chloroflexota bacterium]MBT3670166.1 DUF3088 family protein [Chloroflexota bacterium]MBT4004035.1 DUF3088 family protein [Chloroflexota bacterium]MBT4306160.1 DUF3088 family protein [Chloroflexota bacterium]MBT4534540.1 DUF3088 family protein [Chloroflexota bacterium]
MLKHVLFLLSPGFYDGEKGPFYCPYAAAVEGMFKYIPEFEELVEVHRIAFPRPRPGVLTLLGEENQGTPVLVIAEGARVPEYAQVSESTGRAFIENTQEIGKYLGEEFGKMAPH